MACAEIVSLWNQKIDTESSTSLRAGKLYSTRKGKCKRVSFNFDCMRKEQLFCRMLKI